MPATYIAPGVYSEEIDLSLYVPQLSTTILGLVGGFKKGPVNRITYISNRTQFEQVFGTPLQGDLGFAAHAAEYFLRFGHQLKVMRVADEDVAFAQGNILSDASVPTIIGRITGVTEGTWANQLQIQITSHLVATETGGSETMYNLYLFAPGAGVTDSTGFTDFSGFTPIEFFLDLNFTTPLATNYVEKKVNGNSLFITVLMDNPLSDNPTTANPIVLAGGNDGVDNLNDDHIIGDIDTFTGVASGLTAFEDPLVEDINLISVPGFNHHRKVATYMIALAQTRFDCLAVLDAPDLRRSQDVADYVQGSLGTPGNPYAGDAPLTSANRACIYAPWVKIFDTHNNEEIFVPPSVRTLGVFSFNDNVAAPWFAAAGPNRGLLLNTLDVRARYSQGDVELLYGFGVNVNPIQVTVDGIVVNGNKTLQRKPTMLQNIHVVRMMMFIEKTLATATRYLQWEPHDPTTWRQFSNLVTPFIATIVNRRGITTFRVKCDSETNTAYYINQGQMIAEIHIVPTNAVSVIVNRYIIYPSGASLESTNVVGG